MIKVDKIISFMLIYLGITAISFGQNTELTYNKPEGVLDIRERDPFIPLINESGILRKNFLKPPEEKTIPKLTLMGISKVAGTFYALIDGELLKDGQEFKDFKIEKIYPDKVVIKYKDRIFQLSLDTEGK